MVTIVGTRDKDGGGAHGLRWGVLDANAGDAAEATLEYATSIMDAHPDLWAGGYAKWAVILRGFAPVPVADV
eukprot:6782604-Pyramimonas_sp.AAC.1